MSFANFVFGDGTGNGGVYDSAVTKGDDQAIARAGRMAKQNLEGFFGTSVDNHSMPTKKSPPTRGLPVPVEMIERRIYLIRGQKVMLDRDLAELYQVKAIALRQQVKRNRARFPEDFMFQLTKDEAASLVSQNVIPAPQSLGGSLPYAFTQEGVAMLSSVLRSPRAVEVNIAIMRAFVKLREMLQTNEELNRKFANVMRKLAEHDKYFKVVFDELKRLMTVPDKPRRKIGFKTEE